MEPSPSSSDVVELGKKFVKELGLEDSHDTLARWLANFLAEKIKLWEEADPQNRRALDEEIIGLIFKVWNQRETLPNGKRPFEDLEEIGLVLKRLDPNSPDARYFARASAAAIAESSPKAKVWIERAEAIDEAARALIQHCLREADAASPGEREEWAALAKSAGLDRDVELQLVTFLRRHRNALDHDSLGTLLTDDNQRLRAKIEDVTKIYAEIEADMVADAAAEVEGSDSSSKSSD